MKITNNIPRIIAERSTKFSFVAPNRIPEKTVLISIIEPDDQPAQLVELMGEEKMWDDVLRMAFWDITKPQKYMIGVDQILDPMTEEQGKEIADFIKANHDSSIIVHCRAGISRSAAITKLLLELGWEEGKVLRVHDQRHANVHVYTTVKKHFSELLPIAT